MSLLKGLFATAIANRQFAMFPLAIKNENEWERAAVVKCAKRGPNVIIREYYYE